jgi:hypothetical protein
MSTPSSDLEILAAVSNEVEAAAIVGALQEKGIHAVATGGYISGFKAEAPGEVRILVRHQEAERARQMLDQIRQEQTEIDWSEIDVGEPE